MGSSIKRIQYRYDAVGNRVGMTDPDGGRFTYAYDSVNRISHMVNPQGDRTTYGYDPAGQRTVKKLANGTRASFSYDAANNLTRLANLRSDGTTISSFDYDYDKVGNRTAVLEADGSRVTWSYDDTYQLTGEHRTGSNAHRDTYTYDPAGNRLLKIHDGARTSYSYDAANQLEWSEDASGRTTYTFDADGNQELVVEPSGDRTTTFWDYENRTTLVQLSSGVRHTMSYEPGNLRVKREGPAGPKKFVWDEQRYLAETDENDDTEAIYTNEPHPYGNLVSERRGPATRWYHFDAIGSQRELTDINEVVTDTRLYDAWGERLFSTGASNTPFGFVGRLGYYADNGTGLLYVRHRTTSSQNGRWISRDPVWPHADRLLYAYASNNPVLAVDPSGLVTWWCCQFEGGGYITAEQPDNGAGSVLDGKLFCELYGFTRGLRNTTVASATRLDSATSPCPPGRIDIPAPITILPGQNEFDIQLTDMGCPSGECPVLCDTDNDKCNFAFIASIASRRIRFDILRWDSGSCESDIDREDPGSAVSRIRVCKKTKHKYGSPSTTLTCCDIADSNFDPQGNPFLPRSCDGWVEVFPGAGGGGYGGIGRALGRFIEFRATRAEETLTIYSYSVVLSIGCKCLDDPAARFTYQDWRPHEGSGNATPSD